MKKQQLIIVAVIIIAAGALALLGRTDNQPRNGMMRIGEALRAREVPVVVVTEGRGGANGELVRGVKAAAAGAERARFIHIDTLNPVERETAASYANAKLPLVAVLGLDGAPAYEGTAPVDAEGIKRGIASGLTRKPIEIPKEPEPGEHQH